MDFYALSGLLNGVAASLLGIFVYSRNPSDLRFRAFGLYCFSIALWGFLYLKWQLASTPEQALLQIRLCMTGAILIPLTYLYHVSTLLEIQARNRKILFLCAVLTGIFLLSNLTPYFIATVQPALTFKYWPQPGIIFHFYLIWFASVVVYATYLLMVAYRRSSGIRRTQYLFLVLGGVVGYAGGAATNFPLWYGLEIPPIGTALVGIYISLTAYTMLRHRLLDINVAIEKSLTYLILTVLVVFPGYGILLFAQRAYLGKISYGFSALLLFVFVLTSAGIFRLRASTQAVVGRYFFKERYDMYETLSKFSKALLNILELKTLSGEIVGTVGQVMGIRTVILYLRDKEKDVYMPVAAHGRSLDTIPVQQISVGDNFPQYLADQPTPILREELEDALPTPDIHGTIERLRSLEAEVCLPLHSKTGLLGFCCLGPRKFHALYSTQDLDLLMTLVREATIAVENALLYQELKRSQALVMRSDRLRSLETIAGGFAHEIRNPLTSIKAFVEMAPLRIHDKDFLNLFSSVVSEDVNRIEKLTKEVLDYARPTPPCLKDEDLNEIIESSLYFVTIKPAHGIVTVKKDLAQNLPQVSVDRQQIKQVFLNLFLNAIEAIGSEGGTLTVRTQKVVKTGVSSWVRVEVIDTGTGIGPEDLDHIFDPFYTTKHLSQEHEGTGLGLAISHEIIHEHRGYFEVTSELGKGTTFSVNLPTKRVEVEKTTS